MRPGLRMLLVAVVAAVTGVAGPAAQAKGSSSRKPTTSTRAPKVAALVTDVARIEPLPVAAGAPAPTVSLDGAGEYRGLLELRRAGGGIGAVNEVALDDYLKGISEVPSGWPAEVLRAQAIAARTYLLWTLGHGAAGDAAALAAQICATESCQVYSGVAKERSPNGENWAAAVRDTAGMVLLSGGQPILAKYSACNGGRSVSGGQPYLKAIDDPDDAKCPLFRWGLTVSYDDIGRALAVPGPVKAVRATPGDVTVDWAGDGAGGQLTVPRTEFRARVGAAVPPPPDRSRTVPSILFSLRPDDGARVATLDGRGFGHGIGMSQWGAYGKALRGLKAGAILAAYYGGIQPTKLPAAKLPARVRVAVEDGKPPPAKPAPGQSQPAQAAAPNAGPHGKAAPPPGGVGSAVFSASGPFRVLDGRGKVIVPVALGTWKAVPSGKGVQLIPPRDQSGPPGLTILGVDPAVPLPGQPLTVRFRSSLPGLLSATAQAPGGAAVPLFASQVIGTEERRLTLAPATQPGPYPLTLATDSGPGRTTTLTVTPQVADPNAPPPPPDTGTGGLLGLSPATGGLLGLPPDTGTGGLLGLSPDTGTGGLLGLPPDENAIEGGLAQTLIAAPDPSPAADGRPIPAARASRSSAFRPLGSGRVPAAPTGADHAALGVLVAALTGLALWRFRARTSRPSPGSSAAT